MNRRLVLDYLKLTMSIMVIGLHGRFLEHITALGSYLSVNGLFRIAVPMFLIINGFYFYDTIKKGDQKRWFKRLIIMYLIWSLFYAYLFYKPHEFSLVEIFKVLNEVIFGFHFLWYISGLIFGAVVFMAIRNIGDKLLLSIAILMFLTGIFLQYSINYGLINYTKPDWLLSVSLIHRNFIFISFPFFAVGYLIRKHEIQSKFTFKTAFFITMISLLSLLLESYFNYFSTIHLKDFDNLLCLIIFCPLAFILFLKSDYRGDSKVIGLYSNGLFFIHTFAMVILQKFSLPIGSMSLVVLTIIISFIFSFFIIKINEKVKYLL